MSLRHFGETLRHRASTQGDATAYIFLADGETESDRLSYAALDRKARIVAAHLQALGAVGERVILLYPPGLDFAAAFFGCLYAGCVAVPAHPPRPRRASPRGERGGKPQPQRLAAIVRDAAPRVVLTTSAIRGRAEEIARQVAALDGVHWLASDSLGDTGREWREPDLDLESLAFLQYTSGSTARPKGVMVTHGNLLHNEEMIRRAFGQLEESVVVGWLPFQHDMGLIGNLLQPIYRGGRAVLMPPMAFLQKPRRWLEAISRYRATTSGGPNFAYELCARKITDDERAGLDLSSWRVAFNGAEPVRVATLERFAHTFAPCGFALRSFYPCYGLAEATLLVSGGAPDDKPVTAKLDAGLLEDGRAESADDGRHLAGCGRPWLGQEIAIVDPRTRRRAAPNRVGEIWVRGASVARGYWNRIEATERDFFARLEEPGQGERTYLRTGDLGFVVNGELFVTGRLKDLLILRGRNLYPQDIELSAEGAHPVLRPGCAAAFSVEIEGEERLVVAAEMRRPNAEIAGRVAESVRRAVSREHGINPHEIVLLRPTTLPKTTSGKLQRHACRAAYLAGSLATVESKAGSARRAAVAEQNGRPRASGHSLPSGEIGRHSLPCKIRQEVARAVRRSADEIEAGVALIALGLDSLAAVELRQSLETRFGVAVSLTFLLEGADTETLARHVEERMELPPFEKGGIERGFPRSGSDVGLLSEGQRALWFLHRLAPESAAYNVAAATRVEAGLDVERLRRAFSALTERHAVLRTTFHDTADGPRRRVRTGPFEGSFSVKDAGELRKDLARAAWRPFDLETGPPARLEIFALAGGGHALVLALHHIVTDFWSMEILMRDLGLLYAAGDDATAAGLAPLSADYGDWVRRQAKLVGSERGDELRDYWHGRLAGPLEPLELPTDRPRPASRTWRGRTERLLLDAELNERVHAFARERGTTLFVVLLATFQALLHRVSGESRLRVGSPAAGRDTAEHADVAGYFVNTLVLASELGAETTFAEHVEASRRDVLAALEHQDHPFRRLCEELQPRHDPSRTPLVEAMFTLRQARRLEDRGLAAHAVGLEGSRMEWGGLVLESLALEEEGAQMDLSLTLAEMEGTADPLGGSRGEGNALAAALVYNTDLFNRSTARRLLGNYETLLRAALEAPRRRLSELPLIAAAESWQLSGEWNDTASSYPEKTVHELFEARVEVSPEAVALVFDRQGAPPTLLSYRQLNRRANQLAHHLRAMGVEPESRVALCVERSAELAVAILGILKAGGAYVPLDPKYPAERLAFILEDIGASVVVAQEALVERLPLARFSAGLRLVSLEGDAALISRSSWRNPRSRRTPDNLAYVMYTSGSTGQPKGVSVLDRGVVRLVKETNYATFDEGEVFLAIAPISFDASTLELWAPLLNGGRVVMPPPGTLSLVELGGLLHRHGVSTLWLTTGLFHQMVEENLAGLGSLRRLLAGGDVLSAEHVRRAVAELPDAAVIACYGPTENTTFTSCCPMWHPGEVTGSVSIGRSIANTLIRVVDRGFGRVGVSVAGELCTGGDGLARGYLGRPALTAEKFVPDPFGDAPGTRLYRTGDVARWSPDGRLEFLGRRDGQVKLRGFRIEPGEVEAALRAHPALADTVVAVRGDAPGADGDRRLVAYIVPAKETVPGKEAADEERLTPATLRAHLLGRLPEHMVPSYFVTLDALPLTANGKPDRRALPAPCQGDLTRPAQVAPRTEVERLIAEVWGDLLGIDAVGADDHFFLLGGHSLLLTRAAVRIEQRLELEIPMRTFYEHAVLAELAAAIEALRAADEHRTSAATEAERCFSEQHSEGHGHLTRHEVSLDGRPVRVWCSDLADAELEALRASAPEGLRPHYVVAADRAPRLDGADDETLAALLGLVPPSENPAVIAWQHAHAPRTTRQHLERQREGLEPTRLFPCTYSAARFVTRGPRSVILTEHRLISGRGSVNEGDGNEDGLLEAVNAFVREQGLLRSVVVRRGETCHFAEYEELTLDQLPIVDLAPYPPAAGRRIMEEVLELLRADLLATEPIDHLLWNVVVFRHNARESTVAFGVDHAVSDHESSRVVRRYFEDWENAAPRPVVEPFHGFVDRTAFEPGDPRFGRLREHPLYQRFSTLAQTLQGRLGVQQALVFSPPCQVEIELGEAAAEELTDQRLGHALAATVKVLAGLFGIDLVPLRVLASRRMFEGRNFYNTVGDFHDSSPLVFQARGSEPETCVESLRSGELAFSDEGFFMSGLGQAEDIHHTLFKSPFNFNFLGEITAPEEESILARADVFDFVAYPTLAYARPGKLGLVFFHGLSDEVRRQLTTFLETRASAHRITVLGGAERKAA